MHISTRIQTNVDPAEDRLRLEAPSIINQYPNDVPVHKHEHVKLADVVVAALNAFPNRQRASVAPTTTFSPIPNAYHST
jgi:hypothetical protein